MVLLIPFNGLIAQKAHKLQVCLSQNGCSNGVRRKGFYLHMSRLIKEDSQFVSFRRAQSSTMKQKLNVFCLFYITFTANITVI